MLAVGEWIRKEFWEQLLTDLWTIVFSYVEKWTCLVRGSVFVGDDGVSKCSYIFKGIFIHHHRNGAPYNIMAEEYLVAKAVDDWVRYEYIELQPTSRRPSWTLIEHCQSRNLTLSVAGFTIPTSGIFICR